MLGQIFDLKPFTRKSKVDLFELIRILLDNAASIVQSSSPGGHEVCLLDGYVGNGDAGQLLDLVIEVYKWI